MAARRWLTAYLLAVAAVVASPVSSSGQVAGVTFEDPGTEVLNLSGPEVVRVSVRNNSGNPQQIVGSLRLVDSSDRPANDAFAVLQPLEPIPPTELGIIELVRRGEKILASDVTYSGELTVRTADGQQIVKPVRFVAEKATTTAALEPAVAAWEVTADRWWPDQKHTPNAAFLPLKRFPPGSAAPTLDPAVPLAVLTDGHGQRVTVFGSLEPAVGSAHRGPVVTLSFVGLRGTGKFEGLLDLTPDDGLPGTVQLTLVQKDQWLLPALTVAAGLALAWWSQRFVGVKRHLRDLRARANAVNAGLKDHLSLGDIDLQGFPAAYKAAVESVNRLRDRSVVSIDTESEEFKDASSAIDRLEKVAAEWQHGRADKAFDNLTDALDRVDVGSWTVPPGAASDSPAFASPARLLLKSTVGLEEVASRLAAIRAMTELANRWEPLQIRLDQLDSLLDTLDAQIPREDRDERRLFAKARRLHSGARWDLWHATDPADLKRRTTLEELEQVDDAIGQLSHRLEFSSHELLRATLERAGFQVDGGVSSLSGGIVGGIVDNLRSILAMVATTESSPEATARRTRLIGTGIVLMAAVVTVWGALVTSYFDKPFGSFRDYATLFIWGVGTTAALEAVNSLLGSVVSPLRKATSTSAGAAS